MKRALYARETPVPTASPAKPTLFSALAIVCTISGRAMAHKLGNLSFTNAAEFGKQHVVFVHMCTGTRSEEMK